MLLTAWRLRLLNQSSSKQRTGLIIAFLTINICSPDTSSWQEIPIKPPDVLCQGVGTAGHKTTVISFRKKCFVSWNQASKCHVKVVFIWKFIMSVVNRLNSQTLSGKSIKNCFIRGKVTEKKVKYNHCTLCIYIMFAILVCTNSTFHTIWMKK